MPGKSLANDLRSLWQRIIRFEAMTDTDRNCSKKRNASYEDANYTPQGRAKRRAMHPCNKYAEKPPDFSLFASLYPSFAPYVSYGHKKKPKIDWTDFNATRELTRVLLDHDFGIKWWIPDGQLCPTVPNRANYIHWIDDLLSVYPAPWHSENFSEIRGVDIGTGANCIYPLLGAALQGWHFVGTDVTPVALCWAKKNVDQNPQYAGFIEIRQATTDSSVETGLPGDCVREYRVDSVDKNCTSSDLTSGVELQLTTSNEENKRGPDSKDAAVPDLPDHITDHRVRCCSPLLPPVGVADQVIDSSGILEENRTANDTTCCLETAVLPTGSELPTHVPPLAPVLCGILKEDERFDFCMCNPPFFETIEEAGLNPRTACGGTPQEMVCPGGELAFIIRIIEDSVRLGTRIQWYTSMVGRKVNLKTLTSHLRAAGVTMLRTTEFVQGRTSRWGIAWSFSPVQRPVVLPNRTLAKNKASFMLEGVNRQFSAADVLQELSRLLQGSGAITTVDIHSFSLSGSIPANLDNSETQYNVLSAKDLDDKTKETSRTATIPFQASVFQQVPGTLLIRASLLKGQGPSGAFSCLFDKVELSLRKLLLKTGAQ
ncbi:hypothetical protein R1flu_004499 [Riccia fluitans]|uniref:U6 small nuclear RNA (adenine-(43)-N(6))-methyltransferase n=1 Tax=Riccia fluitans TaxID=41844 RepID=A0ABD1YQG8_9MARC